MGGDCGGLRPTGRFRRLAARARLRLCQALVRSYKNVDNTAFVVYVSIVASTMSARGPCLLRRCPWRQLAGGGSACGLLPVYVNSCAVSTASAHVCASGALETALGSGMRGCLQTLQTLQTCSPHGNRHTQTCTLDANRQPRLQQPSPAESSFDMLLTSSQGPAEAPTRPLTGAVSGLGISWIFAHAHTCDLRSVH